MHKATAYMRCQANWPPTCNTLMQDFWSQPLDCTLQTLQCLMLVSNLGART